MNSDLIVACEDENFEVIRKYIRGGGDINVLDSLLINTASMKGKFAMVMFLIENGALFTDETIRFARSGGFAQISEYLEQLR